MIYLEQFTFPSQDTESEYFNKPDRPTYYQSRYPFQVFPQKGLDSVKFSDITIFCGSNGSGKSTTLNVFCEKLKLKRDSQFNRTELYDVFVEMTDYKLNVYDRAQLNEIFEVSRIITSDDVFNHILKVREQNEGIDFKRKVIQQQRSDYKWNPDSRPREINLEDHSSVQKYIDYADLTSLSYSGYIRSRGVINERTYSNGENGYKYFTDAIQPGGIYLLDEPENSLSAQLQIELADYLAGMARFYKCQFIISSHSPFILSIPFAKIYDMDSVPVCEAKWTQIPSVKLFHDFFVQHAGEF